jgi:hypothetical protein
MAKDQTKRLAPHIIQEDKDVVAAIGSMVPAYAPSNALYSQANLASAQATMTGSQTVEVQKAADATTARDAANAKEWAFHNAVLEAKKQVQAQYGSDSDQVQSIGLKRKSEYKKPSPKKTPPKP